MIGCIREFDIVITSSAPSPCMSTKKILDCDAMEETEGENGISVASISTGLVETLISVSLEGLRDWRIGEFMVVIGRRMGLISDVKSEITAKIICICHFGTSKYNTLSPF